jgi:adenylate cyclase, class 2
MLEVELKVKIPSLDPVRAALVDRKATFIGRVHEHDIYYNAPHRDFGVTDEAVRVRYTDDHAVITYKGPKIKRYGLKAREELNFGVESGKDFETMLDRLGFKKTAEVNKWRETYRFDGATVSLDSVDELGTFAEIEIMVENEDTNPTGQIERIAKEIGAEGEAILASYLELLLSKRSAARS